MITLPSPQTHSALTDWLETSLIWKGRGTRITDTAILDVFAEAEMDDPEAALASIAQTVRSRSKMIGRPYPVARQGLGFVMTGDWRDHLPYSFMLLASLNQFYVELTYSRGAGNLPAELFEWLTAVAVQRYLGCSVIRIGAPRRRPVPASFPAALDHVVEQLNEALGQRDLEDQRSGDDGADLIAWVSFGDHRESQLILFIQCTIGTDWERKREELNLDVWRRHIDWHSHPLKGFAVPFQHERGGSWRETATRGGIVFDRPRIARLVGRTLSDAELSATIERWCQRRMRSVSRLAIEER